MTYFTVSATAMLEAGPYVVVINTGAQKERCEYTLHAYSESPVVLEEFS